jgi:hypothetical protein
MVQGFFPHGDPNRHIPAKQREFDTLSASSLVELTMYHNTEEWTDGTTAWDKGDTANPYKHLYTVSGQVLSGLIDPYIWGWDVNASVITSRSSSITVGGLLVRLWDGLPGDDLSIAQYVTWCKKTKGSIGKVDKCVKLDIPYRLKTGVVTVQLTPFYISNVGSYLEDTNAMVSCTATVYTNEVRRQRGVE